MSLPRPRLYLAGPEVFLPNARDVGEGKCRLCSDYGFEGVYPLDAALDLTQLPKDAQARHIYEADESLMTSCDGLIANLTPFRGVSMDAGTAFEVGFMRALGRPVLGYTNVASDYRKRAEAYRLGRPPLPDADRPDVSIEDLDLSENLMIEVAILKSGGQVVRVRSAVPPGREMEDIQGFVVCLEQARHIFGLGR